MTETPLRERLLGGVVVGLSVGVTNVVCQLLLDTKWVIWTISACAALVGYHVIARPLFRALGWTARPESGQADADTGPSGRQDG
jgi:hypothetical protein